METDISRLEPAALRGFFRGRVAFGKHRLLAHVGHLLGHFWELAEQGRAAELQAAIAAGAAFVEQAVLSNGRLEVAWLLTGLTDPRPSPEASSDSPQRPGTALLAPRWLAANLAFLRDQDFLRGRISAAGNGQPQPDADAWTSSPAPPAEPPSTRTPRGSRGRGGTKRSRADSAGTHQL